MLMRRANAHRCARWWAAGLLMIGLLGSLSALAQQRRTDNQLMLELLNRIEQLEQETRQLRGELELYQHRQDSLAQRLQGLDGIEEETGDAEGRPGTGYDIPPEEVSEPLSLPGVASAAPPPPVGSMPPTGAPATPPGAAATKPPVRADGTEQSDYDEALNKLREGAYEEAITRLEGFQHSYPDSPLNGDALYWLGESYYVIRNFEKAKQTFLTLGGKYPDSKRLPDAMLKLGYIYEEQGDKTKAREVLTKLTQSYPNSAAATHAQRRLQAMK